jgi:hypothetical protein
MSAWIREILGWALVGCGLFAFYLVWQQLVARRILDVIPITFIGFVVFRGGLHLIKVGAAARAVREARAPTAPPGKPARAYKNVIPGR